MQTESTYTDARDVAISSGGLVVTNWQGSELTKLLQPVKYICPYPWFFMDKWEIHDFPLQHTLSIEAFMPVVVQYYRNRDNTHFWRGTFLHSNRPSHYWGQIFGIPNSINSYHTNSTLIFRPFYAVINIRSFSRS